MAVTDGSADQDGDLRIPQTVISVLLGAAGGIGLAWIVVSFGDAQAAQLSWTARLLLLVGSLAAVGGTYFVAREGGILERPQKFSELQPRWWEPVASSAGLVPFAVYGWEGHRTADRWAGWLGIALAVASAMAAFDEIRKYRIEGSPDRATPEERLRLFLGAAFSLYLVSLIAPAGFRTIATLIHVAWLGSLGAYMWWTRLETSGPK